MPERKARVEKMKKKVQLFVVNNWNLLSIGMVLTALAVIDQYYARGYFAIGSEWMITPFLFLVRRCIRDFMSEILRGEPNEDEKRNRRHCKAAQEGRR